MSVQANKIVITITDYGNELGFEAVAELLNQTANDVLQASTEQRDRGAGLVKAKEGRPHAYWEAMMIWSLY